MNIELPSGFLKGLIAIGETNDFSRLADLFKEFPLERAGRFMRTRPEFWGPITEQLSEAEIEALLRALTIAERDYPGFGGGSVSGVIWVFNQLKQRSSRNLEPLADWLLANTDNPYVPFGTRNHGARSNAELQAIRQRIESDRAEKARLERERQAVAAIHRSVKATHDLFAAIRRNDVKAIHALFLRGADCNAPELNGRTAFEYAKSLQNNQIIELLKKYKEG